MKTKFEIRERFEELADYYCKKGYIQNSCAYKKNISSFLNFAKQMVLYENILGLCKNKYVLEVGCFLGFGTRSLAGHARHITAIDIEGEYLRYAAAKTGSTHTRFVQADARHLPFEDSRFDVVVASHVIEHFPIQDSDGFIREVNRVLKNHGRLFIVTPNREFRLMPFQPPFNEQHYFELNIKKFGRMLSAHFGNVDIKGLRACRWIEYLEKRRIRKSAFRAYFKHPVSKILKRLLPEKTIKLLRRRKERMQAFQEDLSQAEDFEALFDRFSTTDFFLTKIDPADSLDLVAVCAKSS